MHHLKLLRAKCVRSAMIPAALLCVIASGCGDEQPTTPQLPRIARSDNVAFSKYFTAWSQSFTAAPIPTQLFALDPRMDRQYADLYPTEALLSFARAYPGRTYIHSDEPDQWCIAPSDYADVYHDWVAALRGADPTARVSPAGFAEPNDHCCATPILSEDEHCPDRFSGHSIYYAENFYNAYVKKYGAPPPVNEWRFHDFGLFLTTGDLDSWMARVDKEAAWSVAHGANMVLGAWGFPGWKEPMPALQEHVKQAMGRLLNDKRILGAVWWTREPWIESPYYLAEADGTLTPMGQTYANPLTDVPTVVTIVGDTQNRSAKLQWSNTTAAWAAEAEFWVKTSGSDSFVYRRTELVAGPGGSETAIVGFNPGDVVTGRVRYYNPYGQAAWSSFSNALEMKPAPTRSAPTKSPHKGPVFCLLQLC